MSPMGNVSHVSPWHGIHGSSFPSSGEIRPSSSSPVPHYRNSPSPQEGNSPLLTCCDKTLFYKGSYYIFLYLLYLLWTMADCGSAMERYGNTSFSEAQPSPKVCSSLAGSGTWIQRSYAKLRGWDKIDKE